MFRRSDSQTFGARQRARRCLARATSQRAPLRSAFKSDSVRPRHSSACFTHSPRGGPKGSGLSRACPEIRYFLARAPLVRIQSVITQWISRKRSIEPPILPHFHAAEHNCRGLRPFAAGAGEVDKGVASSLRRIMTDPGGNDGAFPSSTGGGFGGQCSVIAAVCGLSRRSESEAGHYSYSHIFRECEMGRETRINCQKNKARICEVSRKFVLFLSPCLLPFDHATGVLVRLATRFLYASIWIFFFS